MRFKVEGSFEAEDISEAQKLVPAGVKLIRVPTDAEYAQYLKEKEQHAKLPDYCDFCENLGYYCVDGSTWFELCWKCDRGETEQAKKNMASNRIVHMQRIP